MLRACASSDLHTIPDAPRVSPLLEEVSGKRNLVGVGSVSDYDRMDNLGLPSRNRKRSVLVALALSGAVCAQATEKYWIAHEASLIVVGTFRQGRTYPWIDGWRVEGTIEVNEILYGPQVPRQIEYRFVCRWTLCAVIGRRRAFHHFLRKVGYGSCVR